MIAINAASVIVVLDQCPQCDRPRDAAGHCPECIAREDRADRARQADAAELHRLAIAARSTGVAIHRRPGHAEAYYATDPLLPADLFTVSGWSCDCNVFVRHGRCRHYAGFLDYVGWLPPIPCTCAGRGYFQIGESGYRACGCEAARRLGTRRRPGRAVARG